MGYAVDSAGIYWKSTREAKAYARNALFPIQAKNAIRLRVILMKGIKRMRKYDGSITRFRDSANCKDSDINEAIRAYKCY